MGRKIESDPMVTVRYGIRKSDINALGGKEEAQKLGRDLLKAAAFAKKQEKDKDLQKKT